MKYLCITLFLVLDSLEPAIGQTFDRVASRLSGKEYEINKVDSVGQKQGEWLHYQMFLCANHSALITKSTDTCYLKISEGVYLNDVKIGTWIYYNDNICYIDVERTEVYKLDRSLSEYEYGDRVITEFSPDSMQVYSEVNLNDYTICIECREKKTCVATFENEVLSKFDFTSLDFEQYIMANFGYNRKIKVIRYNKR
jgi:hypothetical protein